MEIGGQDITIKHKDLDPIGVIVDLVYKVWPDAVVELWNDRDEVFLFENREAHDSWDKDGRTDQNCDKMIWISFEPGEMHCVLEAGPSQAFEIIEKISHAVNGTMIHY